MLVIPNRSTRRQRHPKDVGTSSASNASRGSATRVENTHNSHLRTGESDARSHRLRMGPIEPPRSEKIAESFARPGRSPSAHPPRRTSHLRDTRLWLS